MGRFFSKFLLMGTGTSIILASFSSCGMIDEGNAIGNFTDMSSTANNTIWTEVPINEGAYKISATYFDFDPEELISEADYVFSGTVVDRKEYKVQWNDENGEIWGPYPSSIIEVKVNEEYYGKSPTAGDTIKVYYPDSLSAMIDGAFQIKDSGEYIFITRALDEQFVKEKEEKSPDDKFEQEKHADVYISKSRDNIISISDNSVAVYHELFKNNEYAKEAIAKEYIAPNNVLTSDLINSDEFLFFDKLDFDNAFSEVFEQTLVDLKQFR